MKPYSEFAVLFKKGGGEDIFRVHEILIFLPISILISPPPKFNPRPSEKQKAITGQAQEESKLQHSSWKLFSSQAGFWVMRCGLFFFFIYKRKEEKRTQSSAIESLERGIASCPDLPYSELGD